MLTVLGKTLLYIVLLISASGIAENLKSSKISPETVAELQEAQKKGFFSFSILERPTPAGLQEVVLLGETHSKFSEASRSGKNIIADFSDVATEGAHSDKYSGGSVTFFVMRNLQRVLSKSSITDAKEAANKKTYPLEEHHVPSASEQATLLAADLTFVSGATALAGLGTQLAICPLAYKLVGQKNRVIARLENLARKIHPIASLTSVAGVIVLLTADSFSDGLVHGRNRTMALEIERISREELQGKAPLLVIVGKDHVEGISELLKLKYGFRPQRAQK